MKKGYASRELALAGVFGAAALLLPLLFHILHLGSIFMPMYLPLVTLAFFVRPGIAVITAILVPLLSGVASGMPPFYPPVAPIMAFELAVIAGVISTVSHWRRINEWLLLLPVLLLGRLIFVVLVYIISTFLELPAVFLAGVSFLSGWPGIILMLVVIPPFVRRFKHRSVFEPAL